MRNLFISMILLTVFTQSCKDVSTNSATQVIEIDSVWAGHPVGFSLYTDGDRQYIAYYNSERSTVVGQRDLSEDNFQLHVLPRTSRETNQGTSSVLGWDSHNDLTLGVDKDGYIHLSGNVHAKPLTYFRSTAPNDVSNMEQIYEMIGTEELRTTYPNFMLTKEGELIYHYRDGGSGSGNEIYNIYDRKTKTWSRLLDTPLTDGKRLMNAYQSEPTLQKDGWYHMYWVWRDTPDCATNHDLSHMKSRDLKNWYSAFGEPIEMPATFDQKALIVDPIPPGGGIINLAAKMVLDQNNNPVFVYHKYDTVGNLQFFTAQIQNDQWEYNQITNWNYRWEFQGGGSINNEVKLTQFQKTSDGNYEVGFWHIKHGFGKILLDEDFEFVEITLNQKPEIGEEDQEVLNDSSEFQMNTAGDLGEPNEVNVKYFLRWETMVRNRDKPREKPWPKPSQLYLIKKRTII
ncbi:MAG: BNR repeat-containing protein [Cyclobacteriaceae bacterium]